MLKQMSTIEFYKLFFAALVTLGGTGCWIKLSLLTGICNRRLFVNKLQNVVSSDIWAPQPEELPIVRFSRQSNYWRFFVADEAFLRSPDIFSRPYVQEIRHLPPVIRTALEYVRNNGHVLTYDPNNEALQSWLANTMAGAPALVSF